MTIIFTPERMARFLAFMGYPITEIQAALEQQYPDIDIDPAALAAAAVEEQREAEDYEKSVLARNDAAIYSEHNV